MLLHLDLDQCHLEEQGSGKRSIAGVDSETLKHIKACGQGPSKNLRKTLSGPDGRLGVPIFLAYAQASLHGGRGDEHPKRNILSFNITSLGVAWKELNSKTHLRLPSVVSP